MIANKKTASKWRKLHLSTAALLFGRNDGLDKIFGYMCIDVSSFDDGGMSHSWTDGKNEREKRIL